MVDVVVLLVLVVEPTIHPTSHFSPDFIKVDSDEAQVPLSWFHDILKGINKEEF